jgi:HAE1 family hydrophobic/amphiphilic exporter-1
VAVLIPIFFMPGVIGLLFHEFAVVVGLSILVSAVVSLTLVPMLCSRLLKHRRAPRGRPAGPPSRRLHRHAERLRPHAGLALRHRWVLGVAVLSFVADRWIYVTIPKGFFPEEDIGQIRSAPRPPRTSPSTR